MCKFLTRRRMLQSGVVLGAGAAVVTVEAAEDKKPVGKNYFTGGELELLPPLVLKPKTYAINISPDGLAITVLFDSLGISLGETQKGLSTVQVATLSIPFTLPEGKRLVGFTQDIRGYIQKDKGTRVAMMADLGGSSELFEFSAEEERGGENFQRSFFSVDRREGTKNSKTAYTVNFFLSARRPTTKDKFQLQIDSLDFEAILHDPEAPKRTPTPKKVRPKS